MARSVGGEHVGRYRFSIHCYRKVRISSRLVLSVSQDPMEAVLVICLLKLARGAHLGMVTRSPPFPGGHQVFIR